MENTVGILKWLFALAAIVGVSYTAHAETVQVCGLSPPAGFVAVDLVLDLSCGPGPNGNATVATRYDNLPVGADIYQVCYYPGAAIPPGWTLTRTYTSVTRCGGVALGNQINQADIHHQQCLGGENYDLCYPPTGTITASPSTVVVPYGQTMGTTYMSWSSNRSDICIWVKNNPGGNPTIWQCDRPSGANVPWIYVPINGTGNGTTTFYMTTSHTSSTPYFKSTVVTGVPGARPTLTISPTHVIVPVGQTSGTFTMTWSAPGYPSVDIIGRINGGPWGDPFNIPASGTTGDNIPVGTTYDYEIVPHGGSNVLATASVYASH
jgi:hypothetical protein